MNHPLTEQREGLPLPIGAALYHRHSIWVFRVNGVPTVYRKTRIRAKKDKFGRVLVAPRDEYINEGPALNHDNPDIRKVVGDYNALGGV